MDITTFISYEPVFRIISYLIAVLTFMFYAKRARYTEAEKLKTALVLEFYTSLYAFVSSIQNWAKPVMYEGETEALLVKAVFENYNRAVEAYLKSKLLLNQGVRDDAELSFGIFRKLQQAETNLRSFHTQLDAMPQIPNRKEMGEKILGLHKESHETLPSELEKLLVQIERHIEIHLKGRIRYYLGRI